ncbi:NAD-dependent epimerase/dehydratase family protein [Nocardia sp. NPDC003482]
MPNIVIPGAAGFVGTHLLARILSDSRLAHYERLVLIDPLRHGIQTIPPAVVRDPRVRFEAQSIYAPGVAENLVGAGDLVIHVAAEANTADHPQESVADEPLSYLRALVDAGIGRLLFLSSADVYGHNDSDDLTETDPVRPTTIYAAAKAAFEAYLSAFHAQHRLPATIFRPVTIYGPGQFPGWLIPVVITRALAGQRVTLFGDGNARRDWIHVHDVCDLLLAAARTDHADIHGQIYNIGTGHEYTALTVTRRILDIIAHPGTGIDFAPARPGDPPRQITTAAKARATFAWTPRIDLAAGLDTTIAAYRDHTDTQG